jgi:hypothetical protein
VGVEVIRDLTHDPVDGESVRAEAPAADGHELGQHVGDQFGRRLGPVLVPDHDGHVAGFAIGHPAGVVAVVPRRHAGRFAQLTALNLHRAGSRTAPPGAAAGMAKSEATAGLRSFQMKPS